MTPTPRIPEDIRPAADRMDDATRARLRAALAAKADRAGVLDVAYRIVDSPFGALLVASTPVGVVRVAFAVEGHEAVLGRLAADVSPRMLEAPARLEPAARQLDEYFHGHRRRFELPLDLRLARGFRRTVLEHLPDIPYGTTASYASVAGAAGKPTAVRAAASACSHNPLPLLVPCHRVVRSDGAIGNYLGGTEAKRALLALEAAA